MKRRAVWPASWSIIPLALVVLALLGSVAIPARQTWLITDLLLETTQVLAPARLLNARLQSGLAEEIGTLQRYALTGDAALLERYRATVAADEQRLTALELLVPRLAPTAAGDVQDIRLRTEEWRAATNALVQRHGSRGEVIAALRDGEPRYEARQSASDRLSATLASETAEGDDRVRSLERVGLLSNAALVLAALAALVGVVILAMREQRLARMLRRRVDEESALRQLARALSSADTFDEAMRYTTEAAAAITNACGAYGEWGITANGMEQVVAGSGGEIACPCVTAPYADSLLAEYIANGASTELVEIAAIGSRLASSGGRRCRECVGFVVPLRSAEATCGVLVLLRRPPDNTVGDAERRQMRLIGDLAAATFRRVAGTLAERQALNDAHRRAHRETALREAAEALAGAYTVNDVTQRIARAALEAMDVRGAYVEQIVARDDGPATMVMVRSVAGSGVPPLDLVRPLAGSYTERVTASGAPLLVGDLQKPAPAFLVAVEAQLSAGSAMVVPLGGSGAPMGALFVLSSVGKEFHQDDVARVAIFEHLAALAYEKVRLLEEAYEGRRQLEHALQSRSRLMRGFSHDVKNPIGAADGYAELLIRGIFGDLSAAQRDGVDRIRRCIHGALSLIDDLHELARAEAGQLSFSSEPVDLATLMLVLEEEYEAAARLGGLTLTTIVDDDLPPVETNRARVQQISANLLSNAIKYTTTGSVTVHVLRRPEGPHREAGDWMLIQIIDTGPGIPRAMHEFIFEEFSRVGESEKAGAGLGLAISRLLAQAIGGQITVESERGHGATFTLWLPLRRRSDGLAVVVPSVLTKEPPDDAPVAIDVELA